MSLMAVFSVNQRDLAKSRKIASFYFEKCIRSNLVSLLAKIDISTIDYHTQNLKYNIRYR